MRAQQNARIYSSSYAVVGTCIGTRATRTWTSTIYACIHVSVVQKFVAPIKESRCVCVCQSDEVAIWKKGRMVLLKRGAM
jgi:hypothetical protein